MRDDPLKNITVLQAVKDIPELYDRESTASKKDLEKLWNKVGNKSLMSGEFVLICICSFIYSLPP